MLGGDNGASDLARVADGRDYQGKSDYTCSRAALLTERQARGLLRRIGTVPRLDCYRFM